MTLRRRVLGYDLAARLLPLNAAPGPSRHSPAARDRAAFSDDKPRVLTLALVLACLVAPAGSQDPPPAARAKGAAGFEVALWPEEGRPRLVARTATLRPHTEPRRDAPTGQVLRVKKGQVLEFEETVYRTTEPGRIKVLKDSEVTGRQFGATVRLSRDDYYSGRHPTASLAVRAGEVIDYLQYRAEGSCFVRVRGEVMEADPCPHFVVETVARFALEAEPRTEWWVRVLVDGRPAGWLLVDGKTVRETGRTFHAG